MLGAGCSGLDALNPVCQLGSVGGSIAASGFASVLDGVSQWVASGAEWLLGQIGDVLVATTTVDVGARWFRDHYEEMAALAGMVVLPLLLLSTIQAVLRQDAAQLVRTFLLRLPLALLLAVVAVQLVALGLSATDAMSNAVAGGSGADVTSLFRGVTTGLAGAAADPTVASFVLLLVSLLVAVAAFVLWLELLIRSAAVYVAVLFLPLALATLVWPAVSHWCRRLVETLAALIVSKFVIVATLSLAAGALSSGTAGTGLHGAGFRSVLAGGALLLMATFVPFAILRMIPVVEAGAVAHLDGLAARGASVVSRPARSAASLALTEGLGTLGETRLLAQTSAAGESLRPPGLPMAAGDPGASEEHEEAHDGDAAGPKGPKPLRVDRPAAVPGASRDAVSPTSTTTRRAPPDADPDPDPEAWKREGVPPGVRLIGTVMPGKMRYYLGDDGHGPQLRWLPAVWPPGQGPDGGAGGAGGARQGGGS